MANKIGVLYYCNKDGNKSRITRGFIEGLTEQFVVQFNKALDVFSSNIGRRFTERQAYGLFSLALDKIKESKLNYVITEFPLNREDEDQCENAGRLDFLVNYSDVIYAIELKIAYAGLGVDKAGGDRLWRAWFGEKGVVNQLSCINTKSAPFNKYPFENKTIIRLPVLIVCYYSFRNGDPGEQVEDERLTYAHQSVYDKIMKNKEQPDDNSRQPLFDRVMTVNDNSREHRDRRIAIHGLGFFAGAKQFEEK